MSATFPTIPEVVKTSNKAWYQKTIVFYHHSNFFFWHVLDLSLLPNFGQQWKSWGYSPYLNLILGLPHSNSYEPHHPTIVVEIKRRHKGVWNGSASQAVGSLQLRDPIGWLPEKNLQPWRTFWEHTLFVT